MCIAFRLQNLHLACKNSISLTKVASRLQIFSFQFTKLQFDLQTCISDCYSARKTQEVQVQDKKFTPHHAILLHL